MFGAGAMTNSIDEIRDSELMFVIGSNTTEAHPIIAMIGWASVVLDPITNINSESRISSIEFVIAPAPNIVTRPATVGACQVAAH